MKTDLESKWVEMWKVVSKLTLLLYRLKATHKDHWNQSGYPGRLAKTLGIHEWPQTMNK